eukprot:TRINITY_DN3731_c0_g1_i1.p1 TRINITY_DN3731_c0_g1~~TRINITY_DN3731_c0_g1_i1.p1  ORF type:complete len:370 (-),score=83.53 TRINITY_DN3731_c0_g1_i1:226-1284(-)
MMALATEADAQHRWGEMHASTREHTGEVKARHTHSHPVHSDAGGGPWAQRGGAGWEQPVDSGGYGNAGHALASLPHERAFPGRSHSSGSLMEGFTPTQMVAGTRASAPHPLAQYPAFYHQVQGHPGQAFSAVRSAPAFSAHAASMDSRADARMGSRSPPTGSGSGPSSSFSSFAHHTLSSTSLALKSSSAPTYSSSVTCHSSPNSSNSHSPASSATPSPFASPRSYSASPHQSPALRLDDYSSQSHLRSLPRSLPTSPRRASFIYPPFANSPPEATAYSAPTSPEGRRHFHHYASRQSPAHHYQHYQDADIMDVESAQQRPPGVGGPLPPLDLSNVDDFAKKDVMEPDPFHH